MKNVDNSLFYCSIPETDVTKEFISVFQNYSENNSKQVYIIDKALGTENEYSYDISDVAIIMIPKHPIQVLYYEINSSDLEDFVYDLKEDLGHISDKYEYSKILGRVRKWDAELFDYCNIDDFNCQSPDAVAAVRSGNGSTCSTVFKIAVFLPADNNACPLHIGICKRKVCHCFTVHNIRMGSPGNSPDQESALYRIFTTEDDPLYIGAEIRKADHAASVIPALYAYIFHFQVLHPGAFPGHAAEQPYAVFVGHVNLYV